MSEQKFPHDGSYKDFFSHPEMVAALLRGFVDEALVKDLDFSTLERLSGEYVIKDFPHASKEFSRRANDVVWRVRRRDRIWCYVILLLEFQTAPDPLMPIRNLIYSGLLLLRIIGEDKSVRKDALPPVVPIVLYTGKSPWNVALNVFDMFDLFLRRQFGSWLPSQECILVEERRLDLSRESLRDNLMAVLARFGQAVTDEELHVALQEMIRVVRKEKYPGLYRVFVAWVNLVFYRSKVPGDWSRQLDSLEEVYDMFAENVAQWKETWKAEGLAAGMAAGRAEGLTEGIAKGTATK